MKEVNSNSSKRIQLELNCTALDRLEQLKQDTEQLTYSAVIKNALRLYEAVITEQKQGGKFQVQSLDGFVKELVIF